MECRVSRRMPRFPPNAASPAESRSSAKTLRTLGPRRPAAPLSKLEATAAALGASQNDLLSIVGDRYALEGILGHGTYGVVYAGRVIRGGDAVAVKFASSKSEDKQASLAREISVLNTLGRHRNIIPLREAVYHAGEAALVFPVTIAV